MHVYSKWHLLHSSTQVTGRLVNLREASWKAPQMHWVVPNKEATIDLWVFSRPSCQQSEECKTTGHWWEEERKVQVESCDISPGHWWCLLLSRHLGHSGDGEPLELNSTREASLEPKQQLRVQQLDLFMFTSRVNLSSRKSLQRRHREKERHTLRMTE